VPIETAASDNKCYTIRFFLPGSYVKATAPEPTDAKAQIVEVPPASVAVLRFSGSREDERIDKRKAELMEALDDPDWKVTGTPTALFYDPPWTITFLRRNEAVVAVAPSQRQD
jgi:SOUL heme-binding protein